VGATYPEIDEALQEFIARQPLWFVATAALSGEGSVNVSPRGGDALSVIGARTIAWVDYTGSGVETIAHLRENGRICVMWCSFEERPRIVRIHGRGRVELPGEPTYELVVAQHPPHPSTRAVIVVEAERISDSCGYVVPQMALIERRDVLDPWARKKGPAGLVAYRAEHNATSLDGLPGMQPPT
jgi:predicted pyridoxine 5'-phosphate oxidase superfamily flavin-nucleotide-binding protein